MRNHNVGFSGSGGNFVIFGKTSVVAHPSKGTLNTPTLRQYLENRFDSLGYIALSAQFLRKVEERSSVTLIAANRPYARIFPQCSQKHRTTTFCIVCVRRMNPHRKQVSINVCHYMVLTPLYLFFPRRILLLPNTTLFSHFANLSGCMSVLLIVPLVCVILSPYLP